MIYYSLHEMKAIVFTVYNITNINRDYIRVWGLYYGK